MAVGNHRVAASDGSTANPAQVYGGTFIDGGDTSASDAISNRLGLGLVRDTGGTGPTESVHGVKSRSAGTWDYQVAGSYVVRRMATTINGTADTTLLSGASDFGRRSIHFKSNQFGANLLTAHRAGYWRPLGIGKDGIGTPQRTNWATAPTAASANYALNTGVANASADDAARPTRAIPGEFVILAQHSDWTTESTQGDGTVSMNLMKYAPRE